MSFIHILDDEKPLEGWFKVTTISGKPAGLGFHCSVCGLGFRHSAPRVFEHCGRKEKAPRIKATLPTRSLGGFQLPINLIPIGWHGNGN